jgi:hypothetical protein
MRPGIVRSVAFRYMALSLLIAIPMEEQVGRIGRQIKSIAPALQSFGALRREVINSSLPA